MNNQEGMDLSDKSFLVIDDFEDMYTLLRQTLRSCGANIRLIDSAKTGADAIRHLEKKHYDVVLCDYNLGAGKTGQNVLEEARHRQLIGPACAWLIITAEKTNDIFMGAAEAQPDDYLLKPITSGALRVRLAKVWSKKKALVEISAAIKTHDYADAIELCDYRLTFDEANAVELLKIKSKLQLESGNTEGARRTFLKVLNERNLPWAQVGLAKVMMVEGDLVGARSMLEKGIEDNPYFLEAYDSLVRILQTQGKFTEAEHVLKVSTTMSPNSIPRQKTLGEVSFKLGKLHNAEKAFKKCMAVGEHSILKDIDAYTGLAKTFSAKGNHDEALRVIDVLNNDFKDESAKIKSLITEGVVYQQAGKISKAREVAKGMLELINNLPERPESSLNLEVAQLFMNIGDKEKAVGILQEEVKNNPENAKVLEQIKQIFVAAKMGEEGAALIKDTSKSAVVQMNQGVLLAREGKIEDAVLWMRNAREAMPTNARVLFNLAYVLIMSLQKLGVNEEVIAEAHDVLMEANRLSPMEKRYGQLMAALKEFQ